MRRRRRPSASAAALAVALASTGPVPSAAGGDPPAPRQDEILYRLRQDCGSCHGLTLKGGLGPALRPETLAGKDEAALVEAILNGVPSTPMPPWAFEISRAEAVWLVRRLKQGVGDGR